MIQTYKKIVQKILEKQAMNWAEYKSCKMADTREFMVRHRRYRKSSRPLDFQSRATGAYYVRH